MMHVAEHRLVANSLVATACVYRLATVCRPCVPACPGEPKRSQPGPGRHVYDLTEAELHKVY